jgi:succinyl-diaminopimelate desuccinylase
MLYAAKHSAFKGTLSLLLTADEEGEAIHGTQAVLKALQSRGALPDMAIVTEPTCEACFGDTIKIGRRGSINGTLTLQGKSGHVAYPDKCLNPTEALSKVLPKLAGVNLDEGDAHFAPSKLVITDIRGGYEVTNLTPGSIRLMFNMRNATATDHGALEAHIRRVLKEAGISDYELTIKPGSMPFMTPEGPLSRALSEAIATRCKITPKLGTGGGTSDARFICHYCPVVEFGPVNDRIHAPDERVPLEDVQKLAAILVDTISAIAS